MYNIYIHSQRLDRTERMREGRALKDYEQEIHLRNFSYKSQKAVKNSLSDTESEYISLLKQ